MASAAVDDLLSKVSDVGAPALLPHVLYREASAGVPSVADARGVLETAASTLTAAKATLLVAVTGVAPTSARLKAGGVGHRRCALVAAGAAGAGALKSALEEVTGEVAVAIAPAGTGPAFSAVLATAHRGAVKSLLEGEYAAAIDFQRGRRSGVDLQTPGKFAARQVRPVSAPSPLPCPNL